MTSRNSPVKGFRPIGTKPGQTSSQPESESHPSFVPPGAPQDAEKSLPKGTIKCANCNFVMVDHAQFCPACGQSVADAIGAMAATGIICPSCGAGNGTGSLFCGNCGANVSQNVSVNKNPPPLVESSGINISKTHSLPSVNYQPSPPLVASPTSSPIDASTNASSRKLVMPTVPKGAFSSYVKKGNFGPMSIGVLIIAICVLVFGGLAMEMLSGELHSNFLGTVGVVMMALGFTLHATSGFVGLVRLFAKGWTLEILGCMVIGAGSPILYPVMFGFLFYIFAEILPKRK